MRAIARIESEMRQVFGKVEHECTQQTERVFRNDSHQFQVSNVFTLLAKKEREATVLLPSFRECMTLTSSHSL